jgi:hypothetical protein
VAHGGKLQGWVTIRGPDSGTIVQEEDEWLDLWDYDDVVIWCQITDQSNVDALVIQTSPVKDEQMFHTLATPLLVPTAGPRTTTVAFASAATPLARYVRWKCTGRVGSAFSLTFRAWVVASGRFVPPGVISLAPSRPALPLDDATERPGGDEEEEALPEEMLDLMGRDALDKDEDDERVWKSWRPPLLFAGPTTTKVPGLESVSSDLASALDARRADAEDAASISEESAGARSASGGATSPNVGLSPLGGRRP